MTCMLKTEKQGQAEITLIEITIFHLYLHPNDLMIRGHFLGHDSSFVIQIHYDAIDSIYRRHVLPTNFFSCALIIKGSWMWKGKGWIGYLLIVQAFAPLIWWIATPSISKEERFLACPTPWKFTYSNMKINCDASKNKVHVACHRNP